MSVSATGSAASALPNFQGSSGADKPKSAADRAKEAAEAAKAKSQAQLEEIRKKGIYAWAQEQKLEALKAKIRAQMLHEKGFTEKDVAAMAPEARKGFETSLQEEIARLVKEAMEKALTHQAKDDARQGKPRAPMIIDIKV